MIDAHHHIWRQKDLPWLLGPEQPRIFGPYAAIKRDYLIEEFLSDLGKTGISNRQIGRRTGMRMKSPGYRKQRKNPAGRMASSAISTSRRMM